MQTKVSSEILFVSLLKTFTDWLVTLGDPVHLVVYEFDYELLLFMGRSRGYFPQAPNVHLTLL